MNSLLSTTVYVKSGKRVLLKSQESTNKKLEKTSDDRVVLKRKREISIDLLNKYQEDIHHIVKIKKLFDELNETSLAEFLKEYETLSFQECP